MNESQRAEYRPTIKEMPETERPRERLAHRGAGALSNAELLAIILRTGFAGCNVVDLAYQLLTKYGGLLGLARAGFHELCQENGLSTAKVAQLKAALELGRRLVLEAPEQRPQITAPADAANLLLPEMQNLEQEELRVLLLDTRHRVLEIKTICVGSLNVSAVRLGDLFREAIRSNCAAIIAAHNHPSGDPSPSRDDIALTRQMADAGRLLGVEVLDHIIVGRQRFVSLMERGDIAAAP
jgi:DNA repair protein RadC